MEPALLVRRLVDRAAECYRRAGRFAWHFARGKLGGDPVFTALLARARVALGALAQFDSGDIRAVEFGMADTVVVLDVLLCRGRGWVRLHCRSVQAWISLLAGLGFHTERIP